MRKEWRPKKGDPVYTVGFLLQGLPYCEAAIVVRRLNPRRETREWEVEITRPDSKYFGKRFTYDTKELRPRTPADA